MQGSDGLSGSSRTLARMLKLGQEVRHHWQPEELGAVLEHQLAAPIEFDLGSLDPDLASRLPALMAGEGPALKSFKDLFHHPRPPVELLELTKRFAKHCHYHPDSPIPDEIASVLYLLAILVAMTKCGRRISGLDDQGLRYGVDWALEQAWLDEGTRQLFREGRRAIASAGAGS